MIALNFISNNPIFLNLAVLPANLLADIQTLYLLTIIFILSCAEFFTKDIIFSLRFRELETILIIQNLKEL